MEDDDISTLYDLLFERLTILRQENSPEAVLMGTYRPQNNKINRFRLCDTVIQMSQVENYELPSSFNITPNQGETFNYMLRNPCQFFPIEHQMYTCKDEMRMVAFAIAFLRIEIIPQLVHLFSNVHVISSLKILQKHENFLRGRIQYAMLPEKSADGAKYSNVNWNQRWVSEFKEWSISNNADEYDLGD